MFSQLGPLFRTTLRQAESADTRLEIRRDEKQEQSKKQEFEREEESSPLWEDSTNVSVEALRAFLVEFLKSRGAEVSETGAPVDLSPLAGLKPEVREPVNTINARALKAYSAMSGPPPAYSPPPETDQPEEQQEVDLASLLKADELRTMHQLIHELDLLARKGIQTLTIEKADTFLEALVTAVRLEKSKA